MQFLKTFNKTALAVSILIGFTTTSCNSSYPESSDVNAIKMEGIKEGRTFTYGGVVVLLHSRINLSSSYGITRSSLRLLQMN